MPNTLNLCRGATATGRPTGYIVPECGRDLFIKRFGIPIEEYQTFIRATESLKPKTVVGYRRVLPFFFLFFDQTPDEVIAQRKRDLLSDSDDEVERYEAWAALYVRELIAQGVGGGSALNLLGRLQGFFANNGRRLSLDMHKLKVAKSRRRRKYSPENSDVRRIIAPAERRDTLIVTLMYHHGPAPIDVAALRIGDYPAEPWTYFELSRSKTGEVWRGVSTPDGCAAMKAYLSVRGGAAGEVLLLGREGPLDSDAVSAVVRGLIRDAGFAVESGFKPTALRDAFEDALVDAEVYKKTKESLMGHTAEIQHEYGSEKKMQQRMVEAMKKAYPLLCLNDAFLVGQEAKAGFSADEVAGLRRLLDGLRKGEYRLVPGDKK